MHIKLTYFVLFAYAVLMISCIKTSASGGSSSLTILNAINGNGSVLTDFQPFIANKGVASQAPLQYFATANQITYGTSWVSGSYVGATTLSLFNFPDSVTTLWSSLLDFQPGSIHTLFLGGDTSSIDTLLTTDVIPYYSVNDSVAGIRVVNLIWGAGPISVNLQGNLPTQTEFNSLGYKAVSPFKEYNANSTGTGSYVFEIRDQSTDTLILTYQWQYALFKNNTFVIIGSVNPKLMQLPQAALVNNF
jgi:hypothetical protein